MYFIKPLQNILNDIFKLYKIRNTITKLYFLPRATRVHHNNFNRLMDYMKLSSKRGMFYSQLIKKKDIAFILYQTRAYVKEIKSTLLFITILVDIFNKGPWSPPHPRFPLSIVPLVSKLI